MVMPPQSCPVGSRVVYQPVVQVAFSITCGECIQPSHRSCSAIDLNRDQRDPLACEAAQRTEHGTKRRQTALEAAWRADAEERPHPETKIEGAGIHEQPLEHVLVPAHVRAPETASLIEMRTRSLKQLPAFPKESFPTVAADATPIRIDRVAFWLLIDPRLGPRSGSLM